MNFQCPACDEGLLRIEAALELHPGKHSEERAFQILFCEGCGFSAAAVYEESRRGRIATEGISHDGYPLSSADFNRLSALIGACPDPGKPDCGCPAHVEAVEASEGPHENRFPLRFA